MSDVVPDSSSVASYHDGGCCTNISSTEFSYLWIIDNFSVVENKEIGQSVKSSTFVVKTPNFKTEWQLKLYPNGHKKVEKGNISLCINLLKPKKVNVFSKYKLSFLNSKQARTKMLIGWNDFRTAPHGWGYPSFMKLTDLTKNASDLLPNDKLTVCCDLTIITDISTPSEQTTDYELKDTDRVCEDLRSLLESKILSDVTLKVGEKEFRAHKTILAARSTFFATMFQNGVKENEEDVVNITAVDKEAFEKVLVYAYTGKIPSLRNYVEITDILEVAARYGFHHLDTMCEIALSREVTIENAADILMTAETESTEFLREFTKKFIIENAAEVVETEDWKNFEQESPETAIEILHDIAKK